MTAPAIIPSGVITLLTDFGLSDPFVGVMTGAIISRFPAARVVDLCHGIEAQAIAQAAFWLERCFPWFPPGTVHVGNLITNLDAEWLPRAVHVNLAGLQVPLGRTYSDASPGHLLALLNSFGVLEVAEREGSAQRRLGLSRGASVELVLDAPFAAVPPADAPS